MLLASMITEASVSCQATVKLLYRALSDNQSQHSQRIDRDFCDFSCNVLLRD